MAKCYVSGFDELAKEMDRLGALDNDELVSDMLSAGAEVVIGEWKKGIESVVKKDSKHKSRSTGALIASIGTDKKVKKVQGVSEKTVYPKGKDSKGVRNAEKAFILHYGKSGQAPTRFVDAVEDKAESGALEAMENVFNDYLQKEGF